MDRWTHEKLYKYVIMFIMMNGVHNALKKTIQIANLCTILQLRTACINHKASQWCFFGSIIAIRTPFALFVVQSTCPPAVNELLSIGEILSDVLLSFGKSALIEIFDTFSVSSDFFEFPISAVGCDIAHTMIEYYGLLLKTIIILKIGKYYWHPMNWKQLP